MANALVARHMAQSQPSQRKRRRKPLFTPQEKVALIILAGAPTGIWYGLIRYLCHWLFGTPLDLNWW